MNRRTILIIAFVVIGILLFSFVVLPLLGAVPFSASMSGQWYNGDDPVGNPFAFVNPLGTEVTSLRVDVSWTATGANIDTSTFGLGGWVSVSLDQPVTGFTKIKLDEFLITRNGADAMVGSTYSTFELASLLAAHMAWKDSSYGWNLVLDGSLTAQITDLEGEVLTSVWSDSTTYKITWSALTGTFSLNGTIQGTS